ncbi:family 78 glycoside hydrolase catalytic domain [Pedobacter helvus]|uniref:alpha-L-rhamnosidase n=1 Tax=Pedobacter helvus TaxID=2563444 RepID=A0ABW9JPC8_9SPHI|nr:alpha-L-rhamnosidase [Pedobacter ureilyticus]
MRDIICSASNLFAFFLLLIPTLKVYALSGIQPVNLRSEYKVNPVIDIKNPRLSWELISDQNNEVQTSYQIMVASSVKLLEQNKPDIWNSGKVNSNSTNQIAYKGKDLISTEVYYWKVRSWNKSKNEGKWSDISRWEMGLLDKKEWKASWIGYNLDSLNKNTSYHLPPAPYFRKAKDLKKPIKSGRLYITSLGLHEFYINGKRIGKDYFVPGWTDYNKRVYYQVYDITSNLTHGKNAFGAILSYGWYSGYLGYALLVKSPQVRAFYGDTPLLKARLVIEYQDGEKEVIVTDNTWRANDGPLRESDILNGETYNAGMDLGDWNMPQYDVQRWKTVKIYPDKEERMLQVYPGNPVRIYTELKPKSITERPDGKYIVDFGQNFSGVVRLKVKGKAGDSITLRYGEMLHPDGRLMTENLRKARATDRYILKGGAEETWMPTFTYHGFQYAEISGLKYAPHKEVLTGIVFSSATPEAGKLETDNKMVNRLYENIVWTQRSNYFDIPTDCPQRDERLAWTGDAHVYMKSAIYNTDIAAFFTKWLEDVNDSQLANGAYSIYAPMPMKDGKAAIRASDSYSAGWMEAGIICTYELYHAYGDIHTVKKYWNNMKKFIHFLAQKSRGNFLFKERSFEETTPKGGFGDWLSIGNKTSPDLLATMYYGYCANLMAEMAKAVEEKEDQAYYEEKSKKIKKAFSDYYMDETGRLKVNSSIYGDVKGYIEYRPEKGFHGHTQTAYANAIYMNLLTPLQKEAAGKNLKDLINENSGKLATGFLGVKPLLPALSVTGSTDLAYKLLMSEEYPSWGFEVANGATTIWERWNSYTKEKGFENNAGMNSFNHYSFGSVNEWMFENMVGIKSTKPGFREFVVKPEIPTNGINSVKAFYQSINGLIHCSWKKDGDLFILSVNVPVNTKAKVYVPVGTEPNILMNKRLLSEKELKNKLEKNVFVVEVGSGSYTFSSKIK